MCVLDFSKNLIFYLFYFRRIFRKFTLDRAQAGLPPIVDDSAAEALREQLEEVEREKSRLQRAAASGDYQILCH